MKKKYRVILVIFMVINILPTCSVKGNNLIEIIDDNIDLVEIESEKLEHDILKTKDFYKFLLERYNKLSENIDEVNEEIKEELEVLNEFLSYLKTIEDINDFKNNNLQDEENIEFYNYDLVKKILNNHNIVQEYIEFYRTYNDYEFSENNKDIDEEDEKIEIKEHNFYEECNGDLQENSSLTDSQIFNGNLSDNAQENIVGVEKIKALDLQKSSESLENTKVNVSNLKITNNNHEFKITFTIDNELNLADEKNNLKIYIANNSSDNKKILITKDKNLDKYVYLENMTNLSGEILKFGKNDKLSEGTYAVIFTKEELENLNNIGLENLVVKVQADSCDASSSEFGYLEKKNLQTTNKEDVKDSKNAKDNEIKSSETKNTETNNKSLPKTGTVFSSYFGLVVGITSIFLGSLLLKFKKVWI